MISNPYFDPNPTWMFTTLKVWCVVGVLATLLFDYLVIFKSPSYTSTSFRCILLYYSVIGTLFQLHLTILTPPLVYFPYSAIELCGIWEVLGMEADIQITLLVTFIIALVGAIIPLVYYRMDSMLPPNHPLNSKFLRYLVYFIYYVFGHTGPIPMTLMTIRNTPQDVVKRQLEERLQIEMVEVWRDQVIAVLLTDNPWAKVSTLAILGACFVTGVIAFGSIHVIRTLFIKQNGRLSRQKIKERKQTLLSLTILMVIISSIVLAIIPYIMYLSVTHSMRCDHANVIVACAGGIYPLFLVGYIIGYKPYRAATVWCVVGVLATLLFDYLIIFKSPSYNSTIFKCTLLYYSVIGTLFQLHLTILTPPLVYFPYSAMELRGIWSTLGMEADIQMTILFTLTIELICVIVPLFYYRMDVMLPPNHPLNSKFLRYSVYFIYYGLGHICPIPMVLMTIRNTPQDEVKRQLEERLQIEMDGLWKKEVIAIILAGNPWAQFSLLCAIGACCLTGVIAFVSIYVIRTMLLKESGRISRQMRKERRQTLLSLTILMAVITSAVTVFVPYVIYLSITHSMRSGEYFSALEGQGSDHFNVMIAYAGGLFPVFVVGYWLSYKPYRTAILALFKSPRLLGSPHRTAIVFTMEHGGAVPFFQSSGLCRFPKHLSIYKKR